MEGPQPGGGPRNPGAEPDDAAEQGGPDRVGGVQDHVVEMEQPRLAVREAPLDEECGECKWIKRGIAPIHPCLPVPVHGRDVRVLVHMVVVVPDDELRLESGPVGPGDQQNEAEGCRVQPEPAVTDWAGDAARIGVVPPVHCVQALRHGRGAGLGITGFARRYELWK